MQSKCCRKTARVHRTPLEVTSVKPPTIDMMQKLVLIEWNTVGENFLGNAKLYSQQRNLKIHVFFNKARKNLIHLQQLRENIGKCLTVHESLTDSEDAPWTDLIAFLVNFYTKTMVACHHCSAPHPQPKYQVTLVVNREGRYAELQALLKSNNAETVICEGWHATIFDIFQHICRGCELIFATKHDAAVHDKNNHNFLCSNKSCERNKRDNGFYSGNELSDHEQKQMKCQYCHPLTFCDVNKYTEHMSAYHVPCTCSCGKYYKNTEDFLEHYCGLYPLPCLEDPSCDSRFKNIDDQAFHHKAVHGSVHPYFCLACYGKAKLVCLRTSDELMSHVSQSKHDQKDFEVVIIPNDCNDWKKMPKWEL